MQNTKGNIDMRICNNIIIILFSASLFHSRRVIVQLTRNQYDVKEEAYYAWPRLAIREFDPFPVHRRAHTHKCTYKGFK